MAVMEHRSSIILVCLLIFLTESGESKDVSADKALVERCSTKIRGNDRNSFLWTLKEYPHVYLFGTIHRPYTTVWPMLPRNVKRAFKSSKKVYFEIDLTSSQYLLTIMKCQLLPNKQNLSTLLPPNVFTKLRRYLDFVHSQMPSWVNKNQTERWSNPERLFKDMTRNWQRKRPVWMLLQLASLNKDYVKTSGIPSLDLYLFKKARRAHKEIGNIESTKGHCGLNNVNTSQAILYLNEMLTKYNLEREDKISLPTTNILTYHYLCGNLSKFIFPHNDNEIKSTQNSRKQAIKEFEKSLTQELLLKRNQKMAENIIKEVQGGSGKRMFFAIGAGHFLGNGSILDILDANGFKTKHIKPKDSLRRKYNDRKKKKKSRTTSQQKAQKRPPFIRTFSSSVVTVRSTKTWIPSRSSTGRLVAEEIFIMILMLLNIDTVIMIIS